MPEKKYLLGDPTRMERNDNGFSPKMPQLPIYENKLVVTNKYIIFVCGGGRLGASEILFSLY